MSERARDFRVTCESASPPLPSPHTWTRIIRIGPEPAGDVQLRVDSGAPGAPVWLVPFPLYDTHLDWLFGAFEHLHVFDVPWRASRDVPVGGGARWMHITANGRTIEIPAFVADNQEARASALFAAFDALLPRAVLDDLETRRQGYVQKRR